MTTMKFQEMIESIAASANNFSEYSDDFNAFIEWMIKNDCFDINFKKRFREDIYDVTFEIRYRCGEELAEAINNIHVVIPYGDEDPSDFYSVADFADEIKNQLMENYGIELF